MPIDDQVSKRGHHRRDADERAGLSLWARQPYALAARHEADYPLSVPLRRDRYGAGVRPG